MIKLKSFSYNELLIVAAIVTVVFALSAPIMLTLLNSSEVSYHRDLTVRFLRSAQINSMIGKDSVRWGICRVDDEVILYSDSCILSNYRKKFSIRSSVLYAGITDVNFLSNGNPNTDIEIVISRGTTSSQINVNSIGGYEIQ